MATSSPRSAPRAVPKPAAEAAPAEAPRKSRTMLYVLLLVSLVAVLGIAFAAWAYFRPAAKPDAPVREAPKPPVFIVVEPFTVNLMPSDTGEQYLQVALTLQVADQAQVDRIKLYMPQVRSRLLMLLSSKKASEISSVEGKKKLSEEIIAQVAQPFLPDGDPQQVSDVFFTSFVIQ